MIICIVPPPLYSLIGDSLDKENYENRLAAETPTFNLSTLESYPLEYETYFNDRVPFRSQLIELNSIIDFYVFKRSPVSRVIKGKDGWLFYNGPDGDPIADFTGTNLMSEDKLAKCAANLVSVRNTLREQGKEFVVMIAPNKATIYGEEYLPDNYLKAERTKVDLLVAYLTEYTDLTVVYPKDELFAAKKELPEHSLYYKTDTHWNAIGAYVGAKSLLSALNIELPELSDVEIAENKTSAGDLANMMALSKFLRYDNDYNVENYSQNTIVDVTFPIENNENIMHYTTDGQDDRTMFLIHDSFSLSMIKYFSTQFDNLHTVHINYYSPEYLSQVDSDIVVFEAVERYIDNLLSFGV